MASFDERAKDWDLDPAKVERARVVADAIRALGRLKPGMTALEYGCGTGLVSFALQPDFASITLADSSPGMLEVLAAKIHSAGVTNMRPMLVKDDFTPLPETRFDVLYSLLTLHHIPDTRAALAHFQLLLKPGGLLYLADLEKEDGSFHGPAVTDVHRGFEREALQELLQAAGFVDMHFSSVFEVVKTVDGQKKSFPIFLLAAQTPRQEQRI
jgi:ubiquinone/menaquinone biosynthesis C-methylase UbiE